MIYKTNWNEFDYEFKSMFQKKFKDVDLNNVLFNSENNSFLLSEKNIKKTLGCIKCLFGNVSQDDAGDITIGDLTLINYKNYILDNNLNLDDEVANETSVNVWICPNCSHLIFDFLPKYDTIMFMEN